MPHGRYSSSSTRLSIQGARPTVRHGRLITQLTLSPGKVQYNLRCRMDEEGEWICLPCFQANYDVVLDEETDRRWNNAILSVSKPWLRKGSSLKYQDAFIKTIADAMGIEDNFQRVLFGGTRGLIGPKSYCGQGAVIEVIVRKHSL